MAQLNTLTKDEQIAQEAARRTEVNCKQYIMLNAVKALIDVELKIDKEVLKQRGKECLINTQYGIIEDVPTRNKATYSEEHQRLIDEFAAQFPKVSNGTHSTIYTKNVAPSVLEEANVEYAKLLEQINRIQ